MHIEETTTKRTTFTKTGKIILPVPWLAKYRDMPPAKKP